MRFFFFHLMPYAEVDLAAIEAQGSSWVRLPNTHYDPEKGAQLYHRYLDEMERAEALGAVARKTAPRNSPDSRALERTCSDTVSSSS